MSDLAAFLLARISEDEEVARCTGTGWIGPESLAAIEGGASVFISPARVLAECEAKRRIVEAHPVTEAGTPECCTCRSDRGDEWDNQPYPCRTLRLLALPFADHPDYRPEWRQP